MPIADHIVHLESGVLANDTPPDVVDRIVERALSHGGNGLVLHFHGGLVRYSRGKAIAERLCDEYLAAGAYPVFFVWESGLIETITNNLDQIGRESFFRLLWKRLAGIALRKMGQDTTQRAANELPEVDDRSVQAAIDTALATQDPAPLLVAEPPVDATVSELTAVERLALETEFETDPELTIAIQQISNGLRTPAEVEADRTSRAATVQGSTETLMDPATLDELVERPDPTERGLLSTGRMIKAIVAIAAGVISRFRSGRDHGFHATVVEEILRELYLANVGHLIWSQMKQDTADAFGPDEDVHGGTALLSRLRDELDGRAPPKVTLVGHSTGAVYISEFLDKATELLPPAVTFGVILEAPAASFVKMATTLGQHAGRIDGFRMFTMSDERERADRLVPVVYPHSLLYFVSGVVEGDADSPIVGMQRFYDPAQFSDVEFPAVAAVRSFIEADPARVAWSVTAGGTPVGFGTQATKHGAFDDEDAATLASVKHIIGRGF
jgi:hypothetical protein